MLYRILTENVNLKGIIEQCNQDFPGFTIIKTMGYWQNAPEQSLIIEIVTDDNQAIRQLAHDIKKMNCQDTVMIQGISIGTWME